MERCNWLWYPSRNKLSTECCEEFGPEWLVNGDCPGCGRPIYDCEEDEP